MRMFPIVMALIFTSQASAGVVVDSLWREVSYYGCLDQPNLMEDAVTSTALGSFDPSFSDFVTAPGVAEAGVDVAQTSSVDLVYGALLIEATGEAGNYATSLAGGGVADSLAWSELEVVFTADENVLLTVDLVTSSSLGVFYDGPGAGVVGGGCLVDILVDDVTDNGMAVADGVLDSAWLPPGQYAVALLTVSQSITPDVGSAQGSAGFSGEIRIEPAPEPPTVARGRDPTGIGHHAEFPDLEM